MQANPSPATNQYAEMYFRGYDGQAAPRNLPAGLGQVAIDCVIEGANAGTLGGNLVTRPNYTGCLTSLLNHPAYELLSYRASNGNLYGLVTSNGSLYRWLKDANSLTSITITGGGTVDSPNAFAERAGNYIYLVDGTNKLRVLHIDSTTISFVTEVLPPTDAPVASLTNLAISPDPTASTSGWSTDTPTNATGTGILPNLTANLYPNPTFSGFTIWGVPSPFSYGPGTAGGTPANGFNFFGAATDFHVAGTPGDVAHIPAGYTGVYCLLDEPNAGLGPVANISNQTLNSNASEKCNRVYVKWGFYTEDQSGQSGISCEVTAVTPSGNYVKSVSYVPPYANQNPGQYFDAVIDFSELGYTITAWNIAFKGAPGNISAHNISFTAPEFRLVGGGMSVARTTSGLTLYHDEPTKGFWGVLSGARLTYDYGSNGDHLAGHTRIVFGLARAGQEIAAMVQNGLSFRIAFRQNGSEVENPTNDVTFEADGSAASVDITTVDSSVRSSFRYLDILFDGNVLTSATTTPLLTITGLFDAGGLSVQPGPYSYQYIVTEEYTGTDPNGNAVIVESGSSPNSLAIVPTTTQATGKVVAPDSPSGNAGVTTRRRLWRQGGTFGDAFYRLIGNVSIGTSTAYGSDSANPYYGYTVIGGGGTAPYHGDYFIDSTPDSYLEQAEILSLNRGLPPDAPDTVFQFAGRLGLTKGNVLSLSWLLASSTAGALYYSDVNDPNDPELAIKGAKFDVGAPGDIDPVMRALPRGTECFVWKQNSIWVVAGNEGTNFTLTQYKGENQVGLMARKAVTLFNDVAPFLAMDGVYTFDGSEVRPGPTGIQNDINPSIYGATPLQPGAYALSAFFVADQRLFLLVPSSPSDTGPTVAIVLDRRTGGMPVKWTKGPFTGLTGGLVFTPTAGSSGSTSDLYLATTDGQIAKVGYVTSGGVVGQGDKATPGGTAQAVTMTFTAKEYGQDPGAGGVGFFTVDTPQRLLFDFEVQETATLTITLTGDNASWAHTHTLTPGLKETFVRPRSRDAEGRNVTPSFSVATKSKTIFRGFLLQTVQGRLR